MSRACRMLLLTLVIVLYCSTPLVMAACTEVTTFADELSPHHEIHVSTAGSDSTGDGSVEHPFRSIGHAIGFAVPGTAVVIHEGTYAGGIFISDMAGTASEPIWIGGAEGETRPVLSGGSEGLHIIEGEYIILHDLEVTGSSYNGINCDDGGEVGNPEASHHLLFKNLYIHDIGGTGNQDGLKLSGIRDFVVVGSTFARTGGGISGSGVDMVGCHRGLIVGNEFQDMSANAVQVKGGSSDIEIRWNRIKNGGQRGINIGGSTGFAYFRPPLSETEPNTEASNVRVLANTFENSICAFAFVGCVDSIAAHNTIINPTNWLFRILQETTTQPPYTFLPTSNNRLENNIFYFDRSQLSSYINIGPNTSPESFTFARNLWYAHNNPAQSTPPLPVPELFGVYGQNPLFRDVTAGNFRIGMESPAAFAGSQSTPVTTDLGGCCYQAIPSVGAYEADPGADINGDGCTTLQDSILGLGAIGGSTHNSVRSDYVSSGTDVDGDNRVGIAEVITTLRWAGGVLNTGE